MIKAIKIRLNPTGEQEILMFKSVGVARFTWNWALNKANENYENGIKFNKVNLRTEFNQFKLQEEYSWIKEVSAQTTAQAFEDLASAFKNFFESKSKHPQFKSKRKSKKSFYVRYDALIFQNNTVNLEKIGKVKYKTNYEIPTLSKYINPRCHFDGRYWYLTLGFEHNENQVVLNNDLSVGIDLGIKDLAVVSCLDKPMKNINKSVRVRKLKKRIKRLQRQVSRKYEANKQGDKFVKTNNIMKLEKQIKLLHRKLINIRQNHIHQATNKIIKLKPYRVVMEDLNISGMMKNRHLSKAIAEQKFYEFIRQMKYKCEFNGIEFVQVDRWFPSSKTCSSCGNIKSDLKLKDRVYICKECGYVIDRDKNASINLGNYKLA